ncbi:MAG TPA: sugar ABC transporter permease [Herpetosiphonaceae bacterium]|nr:sugar ABC transporter permease [Herpetosiphonaceae bacterium]
MAIQSVPSATSRSGGMSARKRRETTLAFWAFVGPLFIGLIVFTYIPIIWGFVLSFFEARRTVTPTEFVGLQNYITMLNDSAFRKSLGTFAVFALFIVPTTFAFSLGLALLVKGITWGQGFFRSVFFIPTACSYVVASLVWKMNIFNGLPFGLANQVRNLFGMDSIVWIAPGSPPLFWIPLVTVRLWLQVGFYMILFLAGLQQIPRSLYEAAYVDGAKPGWTTFRHITFPLLRNTSIAVLLLNLIAAFQAFDEFLNILSGTGSSNINLARPPLIYLYNVSIGDQDFGRGSAGAFILAAIIIVITLIQGRVAGFGKVDRA